MKTQLSGEGCNDGKCGRKDKKRSKVEVFHDSGGECGVRGPEGQSGDIECVNLCDHEKPTVDII